MKASSIPVLVRSAAEHTRGNAKRIVIDRIANVVLIIIFSVGPPKLLLVARPANDIRDGDNEAYTKVSVVRGRRTTGCRLFVG